MQEKKQTEPSTFVERPGDANAERLAEATAGETLGDLRDNEKIVDRDSTSNDTAPTLTPDSPVATGSERADGTNMGGPM